jgi:hypothetical protein
VERKSGLLSNEEKSMWLMRKGDERSFGDRVSRKRIFSDYVERR